MTDIQQRLWQLRDEAYAAFQAKLTPSVAPDLFIGVRVPQLRAFAKEFKKDALSKLFLVELPHKYYDENMLHSLLLSEIKDFDEAVREADIFLPYVDNWAVCDIFSPKVFKKHKGKLEPHIRRWVASPHAYTCRFGIEMLMSHFLDEDFRPELLEIPAAVRREEYYVRMMVAWFFATALAKQWDYALPFLAHNRLDLWTHNKTIQKAVESYRITPGQKDFLRSLKR